ncbi:MAG: hypothetical protein VX287_07695 [Actinomycetota bacterium]|nr:hypothetical protein [Actinomycetota bacterium]|tara:strand:- start:2157 stop:2303 length:147 start_codon:yes stop_codon:yes gene_type:complete
MSATALVLAHQGGWDEILMVAAPLALLAWVLWLADRRARRTEPPDSQG